MADDEEEKGKKGGKRKKKEKKKKIVISLYINQTPYEFGCLCTFCTKIPAVLHCAECTDFYCLDCDATAHSTKKRRGHIRNQLSKLDKDTAGRKVTYAVRYHGHLLMLQAKCRATFRRFFDAKTLCHYYYNPVYRTTSWRKPYCLRKTELLPFMTEEQGAALMQVLYRKWIARQKVISLINLYYRKIFDRLRGRFYYAFNGKSKLLPRQSWRPPRFFGMRGYMKDILPIFTPDVACIVIQRKWRALSVRKMLWALTRAAYDQIWDPVNGRWTYFHRETEILYDQKPLLMKYQPWDPDNVLEWSVERVSLFLRRIGLKQYVKPLANYGVDGRSLALLDDEDFDNLEIWNRVHRRKIQYEVKRIFTLDTKKESMGEAHAQRREDIRKVKLFNITSTKIQTQFRMYRARQELYMLRELKRLGIAEENMKGEIKRMGIWWTNRHDIPSKKLYMNEKGESVTGESISSLLPPLKTFGRKRDHLTSIGWGRRDGWARWLGLSSSLEIDDSHPTQFFTKKLFKKGYDNRRIQRYKGLTVQALYDDSAKLREASELKQKEELKKKKEKERRMAKYKRDGKNLALLDEPEDEDLLL